PDRPGSSPAGPGHPVPRGAPPAVAGLLLGLDGPGDRRGRGHPVGHGEDAAANRSHPAPQLRPGECPGRRGGRPRWDPPGRPTGWPRDAAMTCLEVRAKLAEYALAQLARVEANEVDRHLAWCTGCRKEAGERLEGATAVAYTLVPAEPRMGLEDRVVDRITTAAGTGRRHRRGSNRTVRVLASVTVAAVLAATGAV